MTRSTTITKKNIQVASFKNQTDLKENFINKENVIESPCSNLKCFEQKHQSFLQVIHTNNSFKQYISDDMSEINLPDSVTIDVANVYLNSIENGNLFITNIEIKGGKLAYMECSYFNYRTDKHEKEIVFYGVSDGGVIFNVEIRYSDDSDHLIEEEKTTTIKLSYYRETVQHTILTREKVEQLISEITHGQWVKLIKDAWEEKNEFEDGIVFIDAENGEIKTCSKSQNTQWHPAYDTRIVLYKVKNYAEDTSSDWWDYDEFYRNFVSDRELKLKVKDMFDDSFIEEVAYCEDVDVNEIAEMSVLDMFETVNHYDCDAIKNWVESHEDFEKHIEDYRDAIFDEMAEYLDIDVSEQLDDLYENEVEDF